VKSLFNRKKTTALMETGKTYLKLALVEDNFDKNRIITKLVKQDSAGNEAIARILERESFDDLVIVLPRNQVTVRNLELPTTDPQEIKDIISIQAGKQTPFSKDEIVSDFQTIGLSRSHYTKVLLAIVQKSVINNYLNNFAGKKEIIQKVVLDSECFDNWYSSIQYKIGDETFAILDFSSDFSDFCVLSKGKLLFTKLLPLGIRNLSKKGWQEAFFEEIKLLFNTYRKENIGPAFNKVIFTDATPNENLKDILTKQFSLEVLSPFEDIESIVISSEAKTILDEEKKKGVSFFKLIGLALNPDRSFMDFLPQGLKQARQKRIKRKKLMLTGILILLVFILGGGIFLERIYTKALLLKRLNTQLIKLEEETTELKKEDLKIKLIKSRIDTKNSAIEVLREIHKVTPQEIYLAAIGFDESKQVSLRGSSVSMSEVFKFVKTLKKLPIFKDVKTKYITKRKLKGKDLTDFEITCPLVSD